VEDERRRGRVKEGVRGGRAENGERRGRVEEGGSGGRKGG